MMITFKMIHIACVVITICGFLLRSWWMIKESPLLHARLTRVLPHIVDTLLLASGVMLVIRLQINPFYEHWLLLKLILLVVYIFVGAIALKYGKTIVQRSVALTVALFAIAGIVFIARFRGVIFF